MADSSPFLERFWRNVTKTDGCWTYGITDAKGYGRMKIRGKFVLAHRFSFQIHWFDVPPWVCVCHTCDTPSCVNPDHLFLGLRVDNNADAKEKGRLPSGENSPVCKLTDEQVRFIREEYKSHTARELSQKYGVHPVHIQRVATGARRGTTQ